MYIYIYVYVNMYIYICEPGPRISTPPPMVWSPVPSLHLPNLPFACYLQHCSIWETASPILRTTNLSVDPV